MQETSPVFVFAQYSSMFGSHSYAYGVAGTVAGVHCTAWCHAMLPHCVCVPRPVRTLDGYNRSSLQPNMAVTKLAKTASTIMTQLSECDQAFGLEDRITNSLGDHQQQGQQDIGIQKPGSRQAVTNKL